MLDSFARKLIDPPLNRAGRFIASKGLTADGVTLIGLGLGQFICARWFRRESPETTALEISTKDGVVE